jgi:hypothetical protein
MKFLKTQYTSRYSPSDNTIRVNTYGRAVMDFSGGVLLPKGTTAQRPQLTSVRQPTDANGTIRYNTDLNEIEAYVGGNWETVRAPGASAISIETFGPGDLTETVFGPLTNVPASANNIIVLVENVMQIPTTNFTLEQSSSGSLTGPNAPYADGWYLKFTSPVPLAKYVTMFFGFAN